jgi:hypothetical protein
MGTGLQRRDDALDLFAKRETSAALVERIRAKLITLAQTRAVSGDDATDLLDAEGYSRERRIIGAIFRPKSGWVYASTIVSRHARRHGRRVTLWFWEGIDP